MCYRADVLIDVQLLGPSFILQFHSKRKYRKKQRVPFFICDGSFRSPRDTWVVVERESERADLSFSCGRRWELLLFFFLLCLLLTHSLPFTHFQSHHCYTQQPCPLLLPTALLSSSTTSRPLPPTLLVSLPDRSPSSPVLGNLYLSFLFSYFLFLCRYPSSHTVLLASTCSFFNVVLLHAAHIATIGRGQFMNRTKAERETAYECVRMRELMARK